MKIASQTLDRELDRLVRAVVKRMHPERIILFGSAASGAVDEWSDLDLVVVAHTELPYAERRRIVDESVRPAVGTDVYVYTPAEWDMISRTHPFFRDEVIGKGRVVYETGRPQPQIEPAKELYNMDPAQPWIESARRSLEAATVLHSSKLWPQTCFNAHQCVELGLKAAILADGAAPPRTHNLPVLVRHVGQTLQNPLRPFDSAINRLNRYYEPTRYPDALGTTAVQALPGQVEATEALAVAREVLRIIDAALAAQP